MNRTALTALVMLTLTGCSQAEGPAGEPTAPAAPARPVPTAAEKVAMLASLPAPYNAADLDNGRRVFARCRS
jgi:cytochrome c